jgi:hypothetical protein
MEKKFNNIELLSVMTAEENTQTVERLGVAADTAKTDADKTTLREMVARENSALFAKYVAKHGVRAMFAADYVKGYFALAKSGEKKASHGNKAIKPESCLYEIVAKMPGVQSALENARYTFVCYALQVKWEKLDEGRLSEIRQMVRTKDGVTYDEVERVKSVVSGTDEVSENVACFSKRGCKRTLEKLFTAIFGDDAPAMRSNYADAILQNICKMNFGEYVFAQSARDFFKVCLPVLMAAARGTDEVKARAKRLDEKEAKQRRYNGENQI